ncbi:MAG: amidase [Hyphomicrobiaceae bacterium]
MATKPKTTRKSKAGAAPPLNTLSASEAARGIAAGAFTSEALVGACLKQIEEREPAVRAWAFIDPGYALRQARELDREFMENGPRGPLHGVPVGIKDVIDTADMPTQMGSSIYDGHRPKADAACVAMMRRAGAVILGKTVTCELAGVAPRETMNPLDPQRTPGGSSSGSGAAVADFHVPVAFGTQTGGSVLRPASFCGVIGYKPTYNLINRAGLKFAAEGVDTIGFIGRTVEDMALVADACVARPHAAVGKRATPPRIGLCRTFLWDEKAQPETKAAVDQAARRAERAGASVIPFELPAEFTKLTGVRDTVNNYERAMGLAWEWDHHRDQLSPQMARTVEQGLAAGHAGYVAAVQHADHCRRALDEVIARFDILLAPAVNGEAPLGLDYAGDPAFQALWTLLHVPTMTLPLARGPHGMPVGVQLVAGRHADRKLLDVATWMMETEA